MLRGYILIHGATRLMSTSDRQERGALPENTYVYHSIIINEARINEARIRVLKSDTKGLKLYIHINV